LGSKHPLVGKNLQFARTFGKKIPKPPKIFGPAPKFFWIPPAEEDGVNLSTHLVPYLLDQSLS
jgi:hypothetical protein